MNNLLYTGFYAGCNEQGKEKQPDLQGGRIRRGKPFDTVKDRANILGVLAEDVVMVDFDTTEDSAAFERILASQGVKVPTMITTRGKHFYFKAAPEVVDKAHTHVPVACGLIADFKLGDKRGLDLVKFQGVERQWLNEDAELRPVPRLLTKVGTPMGAQSLALLTEGSRNDTLFKFVGKLKRAGFNEDEAHRIISAINKYVLPQPLPERELATICRKDAYDGAYAGGHADDGERVDHTDIGKEIMEKHSLAVIGGAVYGKIDNIYKPLSKLELDELILDIDDHATVNRRREVVTYCMARAKKYEPEAVMKNPELIPFSNGVVDITKQTVAPFEDYDMPFTNRIDFEFPDVADTNVFDRVPDLDNFLDAVTCGRGDRLQSLYEMAGACLYRMNALRGIFILVGNKANGKSTFLKFLNYCLGRENVSNLSLHDLSNPFYVTAIQGKLANLGDDIGDSFVADSSVLKSIATSDRIMGNIKFKDPVMFTPYCTLIFTANFIPRISDPTGAVQNRLQFVKFEADFSQCPDVHVLNRLCKPNIASIFLARAAWFFTRALSLGRYMPNKDTFDVSEEFSRSSNPVLQFLDDEYEDLSELIDVEVSTVYDRFTQFCASERCSVMSRTLFARRMKAAVHGLEIAQKQSFGERKRFFVANGKLSRD